MQKLEKKTTKRIAFFSKKLDNEEYSSESEHNKIKKDRELWSKKGKQFAKNHWNTAQQDFNSNS